MYLDPSCVINTDVFEPFRDYSMCIICSGIVYNPKQCKKCEYCFCGICIKKWTSRSNTCPMKCNSTEFIEPCRIVKNMLSKLVLICPLGCDEKIPYDEMFQHESTCESQTRNCPMCESKVHKGYLNKKNYEEIKLELKILERKTELLEKENEELKAKVLELTSKNESTDNLLLKYNSSDVKADNDFSQLLQRDIIYCHSYNFKYEKYGENACPHRKSNKVPIFDCCGKAYPCKLCHDTSESHKRGKCTILYCKRCYAIFQKGLKICDHCKVSLAKEK
jgi:hypothetical protein